LCRGQDAASKSHHCANTNVSANGLRTMTAKELIDTWHENNIFKFDKDELIKFSVDSKTIDVLSNVGLPEDAAPFLIFGGLHDGKTIADIYGTENPDDKYLIEIGIDGVGDTICIDVMNNNEIVACDHEDNFSKRYMNSSVTELLHFITIYRDFGQRLISKKGEDAFIESNFSDGELDELLEQFRAVDKKALDNGTYWSGEIQTLTANRKYYQEQGHRR
jgi:hypothetical protein